MKRVHFDTDPGCDDAVMLAMALGAEEIDVVGISTVYGNSTVDNTTQNALSILELRGDDVPVARGCHRPLVDDPTTAEEIHGEAGIRGDLPAPSSEPIQTHGAEFLVEQAYEYGSELVIAAVGPLTNLATALALEPDLPDLVGEIYLMGGSISGLGNVTPAAEANVYNDPAAASRVFQEADPKMVGLDVTNHATVTEERINEYRRRGGVHETIGAWLDYREGAAKELTGGAAVHDAAVVADLVDSDVLTFERVHAAVDTAGGPAHGSVVADQARVTDKADNCAAAVDIDVDRFRELLSMTLESYAQSVPLEGA